MLEKILRIIYLFIKSAANPFVDITSTLLDSSFNSFLTSTCFILFDVTFLFKFFSLSKKFVFFAKSRISFSLAKFACFNLSGKLSYVNLLNY